MSLPSSVAQHLRGVRHVGVVTEDSEKLVGRMKQVFGLKEEDIQRVPPPGTPAETRFVFFSIGGLPYEIIEPVSARFRAILLKHPGVNHVCYNVDDIDAAVAAMAAAGVRLGHVTPGGILQTPSARMAYFDPEDTAGMLIEFVQARA